MNISTSRPMLNRTHVNSSKNGTDASTLKPNALTSNSVSFCGISGEDAVAKIKEVVEKYRYGNRSFFQSRRSRDSYAIVARAVDLLITNENAPKIKEYLEMAFKKNKSSGYRLYDNLCWALEEEAPEAYNKLYPPEKPYSSYNSSYNSDSDSDSSSSDSSSSSWMDYYSGMRD